MKYIFVAGAPGSKWSSVVKNIYYSPDIDRSDDSEQRSYATEHAYSGTPMHLGSYFDPGMEFGRNFDRLDQLTTEECEAEFDRPFSGTGVRIIKSHVFCHHIDFLKTHWPDCPVVTVYRPTDACLGWWVRCGGFDISYPKYRPYYKNIEVMYQQITAQNHDMIASLNRTANIMCLNNRHLCNAVRIRPPADSYQQDYPDSDVYVRVLQARLL